MRSKEALRRGMTDANRGGFSGRGNNERLDLRGGKRKMTWTVQMSIELMFWD